jgi:hemerythrin
MGQFSVENSCCPGQLSVEINNHKLKHMEMISNLSNKVIGLTIDSITPKQVQEFLVDWFLSHTIECDGEVADFQRTTTTKN